jgi:2,4-dienoyl-CoA reductase-like NADH-dependent reductase (Old Yellow Enzyme family)
MIMAKLFSSFEIKSVQLKNRIVISPMCQYSAEDGFANDWHLVHLGSRAVGGAGLIIVEACAVAPEGRISPHDLGLWKDEHIPNLKRISVFIESQGTVPAIQLAHAGRKASCAQPWNGGEMLRKDEGGWQTVAPTAIPFNEMYPMPVSLSIEGIQKLVECFKVAAKRAFEAGFKIIEIHAAHGYLIHEFFSPLSNQRTDAYGGSFQNRIRFLCEVVTAIQAVWPANLPIFVRISATDWVDGGWNIDESIELSGILKEMGIDLIDCSSGGNISNVRIPLAPGYQVPFSKKIKEATGIATGTVGLIIDAQQAEDILLNEEADLILFARESLRNPYFPLNAAAALNEKIDWPIQYARAKK